MFKEALYSACRTFDSDKSGNIDFKEFLLVRDLARSSALICSSCCNTCAISDKFSCPARIHLVCSRAGHPRDAARRTAGEARARFQGTRSLYSKGQVEPPQRTIRTKEFYSVLSVFFTTARSFTILTTTAPSSALRWSRSFGCASLFHYLV